MATSNEKSVRGFFKNNPFFSVEEKPETTTAPSEPVQPLQPFQTSTMTVPNNTTFPMPPPVQVPDLGTDFEKEYLDHFMKFLESKNFVGLDYFEFANTLHKMYEKSGSQLTESGLYELAFVSFEAQGVTSSALIKTAQQYVDLITVHKQEFDKFLSNEGSKLLQEKQEENTRLEKGNSEATLKIAQLQQQIVDIQASVGTNTVTINTNLQIIQGESQKNLNKKSKFDNAFQVVIGKINGDIQKIQSYIK